MRPRSKFELHRSLATQGVLLAWTLSGMACDGSPSSSKPAAMSTSGGEDAAASSDAGEEHQETTSVEDDGSEQCPPPGDRGVAPGQVLLDLSASDCDGQMRGLHALACGQRLTLVDIGGAALPGCIEMTKEYIESEVYADLRGRGLNIVQVFDLDDKFQVPTLQFCRDYVAHHAIDFDFLVDQREAFQVLTARRPINILLDGQARILEIWIGDVPDNKAEIIAGYLRE